MTLKVCLALHRTKLKEGNRRLETRMCNNSLHNETIYLRDSEILISILKCKLNEVRIKRMNKTTKITLEYTQLHIKPEY